MSLENQTAIVTGGSQGIGRSICLKLASMGANIVINYLNDDHLENAKAVQKEVEAYGVQSLLVKGDVSQLSDVETMIKEVQHSFPTIDILVNNAGITKDALLMRMKESEFDAVINVNLKGTWNCMKVVARPMMKQRSGKIISLASVVGVMGNVGQINYAASKAGIIGMTKTLARELAGRNIRVNAVAPGFIQTHMTAVLNEDIKTELQTHIPLGVLGTAEDVAEAVAFLASDRSKYITGQVIHVDGGMAM